MEFVILNMGPDIGVISRELIAMLVFMAVVTTLITPNASGRWEAAPAGG